MKKKEFWLFFSAFIIPIIIMGVVYFVKELFPFGKQSLLSMDLWGQYYPMIKAMWYDMRSLSFDKFSWDGGLGFNLFAQTLYYTNSIFYKLLVFVSENKIIEGLNILLLIKYGCCSVSFLAFLKYKFKDINLISLSFSVSYALCSYSLAYINQPMWTDCIWLFPIVIISLERLIYENKSLMYAFVLAYTIYTNFYIAFSICIFVFLYFIVALINMNKDENSLRINAIKRFVLYSLLAGGLSAFSILTVYMEILNRVPVETEFEYIKFYHSLSDVAASLFMFTDFSFQYFVPNIYSGIFIIPFIGIFIGNNDISIKKRVSYVVLTIFLILSLNVNILDFIWHGFHFPNQLPGRWSFIFSFLVLSLAYEGILFEIKSEQEKSGILMLPTMIIISSVIYILGITAVNEAEDVNIKNTITLCFMLIYILLAVCLLIIRFTNYAKNKKYNFNKRKKYKKLNKNKTEKNQFLNIKTLLTVIVAFVIIAETAVNSVYCSKKGMPTSEITNYFFNESMNNIKNNVFDKDKSFYRTEMNPGYTFDPGLLFDFKGISYYSSTMNGGIYDLMEALGNRVYAKNVSSVYNTQNIFTNSLFSVKYIIDRNKDMNMKDYETIDEGENYRLLLNNNWLPPVFPVNGEILNWFDRNDLSPLEQQNDFINKALGKNNETFIKIEPKEAKVENADLETGGEWKERHYIRLDNTKGVSFDYSFECDEDGSYYAVHNFVAGELIINAAGTEYKADAASPTKYIGELKKGDIVNMTFNIDNMDYALYNIELYRFDSNNFKSAINELKEGGLYTEDYTSNSLKGDVEAKNDNQLFFTSIPDDGGWKVYCDGKKIETKTIANSLIGFYTPVGKHDIILKHHTRGLMPGTIISIVSFCIIILINRKKLLKLIKKNKD